MEIELKYAIAEEDTAQSIWLDGELESMIEEGSRRVERYDGVYYDTDDFILADNDITFRIRREGENTVACLKWNGSAEGSLFRREELNVTVCGDIPKIADPDVFAESEKGQQIIDLIGEKKLAPMIEVDVLRKSMRVDTGSSILEISIDTGQIVTDRGTVPVSEVEVELYQGDEDSLLKLGRWLTDKYDLAQEENSKFARGIAMLR